MAQSKDPDTPGTPGKPGRRSFFRQLFLHGLEKVEDAGKKIAEQVSVYVEPPKPAYTPYDPSIYNRWDNSGLRILRPPGALPAQGFADTCSRCGDCVRACPARAIRLTPDTAGGLPHLIARESPCVVCTDLSCMKACPTGALRKLDSRDQIQMGYAITDQSRCLRGGGYSVYDEPTSLTGEDCQLCVTQCPIGKDALTIDNHGCIEVRHGCIGCGVCEQVCPTESTSIWVEPW